MTTQPPSRNSQMPKTPPPGARSGVRNAVIGSLMVVLILLGFAGALSVHKHVSFLLG